MHGCTPKIIIEHVGKRRVWPEIAIIFNRADIVEDEAAVATVVITDDAGQHHDGTERMLESHPLLIPSSGA